MLRAAQRIEQRPALFREHGLAVRLLQRLQGRCQRRLILRLPGQLGLRKQLICQSCLLRRLLR